MKFNAHNMGTFVVISYIAVQSAFPDIERYLFWGELFVIILIATSIRYRYRVKSVYKPLLIGVFYFVFCLPVIGIALGSYQNGFEPWFAMRHLSYFIYGIFFFYGFRRADDIVAQLTTGWLWIVALMIIHYFTPFSTPIGGAFLIGLIVIGAGNQLKNINRLLLLIIFAGIITFVLYGQITNLVLSVVSIILATSAYVIRKYPDFAKAVRIGLILIALLIMLGTFGVWKYFDMANVRSATSFQDVMEEYSGIEKVNTVWRLAYWGYLMDRLKDNPLGIGIGTPFLETTVDIPLSMGDERTLDYAEYVVAPHNAFVTYLVRLGPFFLIFIILSILPVARLAAVSLEVGRDKEGFACLAAFYFVTVTIIEASFNVVMESPLYAGCFWFSLGLWMRLAVDRQFKNSRLLQDRPCGS